jgi:hypothetical protein
MKYLTGTIDLGALGKIRITCFPVKDKQGNQPDWKIYVKDENGKNKDVGALWENEKRTLEVQANFRGQTYTEKVEIPVEPPVVEEEVVRG